LAHGNYFLNLFRPNTPRPTKPDPISKSVEGSGTALMSPPVEGSPGEAIGVEVVEVKLDVVAGSSDEGQPTIPKNIITIHKNKKNFFMLFLHYYKNANIIQSPQFYELTQWLYPPDWLLYIERELTGKKILK
jgi:hypothetical protein